MADRTDEEAKIETRRSANHVRGLAKHEPIVVCDADRAAFARQAATLEEFESTDDGNAQSRAKRIEEADRGRARHGIAPLKTEPELHRLARDLGLIRR